MALTFRRGLVWKCGLAAILLVISVAGGGITPAWADSPPEPNIPCAVPSDACWQPGFHLPGVSGTVNALVRDSVGRIYVGGEIVSAGGVEVNNLALWDGTTWRDVGGGVTRSSGTARVYALALDDENNLIVGGYFSHAGGMSADNLAVWNGSAWQEVGGGADHAVRAIEMVSGGMYIGGSFDHVGTMYSSYIVYRDFQTGSWQTLGNMVMIDDLVNAIEFEPSSNSLFVGGAFGVAAGAPVRIARFDLNDRTWHEVGGGLWTSGGEIFALQAMPRSGGMYDLYVGGTFSEVGFTGSVVSAHNIARWDGSAWHPVGYGTSGRVNAIAITAGGDVIVGGDFSSAGSGPAVAAENIARWNGSAWSVLGSGVGSQSFERVNALLFDGSHLVAGGRFDLSGQQVVNHLARWNGAAWSSMDGGLGVNNLVDVLLADNGAVYAAGNISQFGSLQALGLAKLSGSAWSGEGSPAGAYIRALVKAGPNLLYAGGAFTTIGAASASYLAQWNGASWSQLAGGTNGYVNALVLDGDRLYAGGEFTQVGGGLPASRIAMWNGTWHALGDGLNGAVRALALDADGNLYAAGEFTYAGGLFVNHIARWDGSQWHALGSGLSGSNYVLALTFDGDGRLYAGGYFGTADGLQANGVAMWNGLEWSVLGGGMDDGVGALVVDANGYLYAGGDFDTAGGSQASHIARWDGFTWSPLGSGTDNNVRALALTGEQLVAGGVFKSTGGLASSYIGAYTFPPPGTAPAPTLSSLAPSSTIVRGSGLWLTVNGANFSSRSQVRWNGSPLVTSYRGANQLRAFVPADKIATAGTATVLVFTPAPSGGGASFSLPFEVLTGAQLYIPLVLR